ncbi:hypothetical protein H9P43_009420 [Blastocladiella emersonii ATCC 22665]|nr:hypothetical protein H9P43_009420 [Blastocladiella emersonii ATCC 22665]
MPVVLRIPEVIERMLCAAVQSLHPDDFNGFWQLAHVLPANQMQKVHTAILKCSKNHTFEGAMHAGHVALLEKWKASGLTLRYNALLIQQSELATLEWFRESGLSLDCCRNSGTLSQRFPEGTIAADAAILDAVDAIAAGKQTELVLQYQPISDESIEALNAAMASPNQALESLDLHGSTIDCDRLIALEFPTSLKSLNLQQSWIPDTVHKRWLEVWEWPEHLEHINLTGNAFDPDYITWFLESLPPGLKWLNLTFNQLGDEAALEVVQNMPRTVTSLDLSSNNITGVGLQAICQHLPPALKSLSMTGNSLAGPKARTKLTWTFPAAVTKLDLHVKSADITVTGAKALFPALPASLRSLDFSSNRDCEELATFKLLTRHLPANLERLVLILMIDRKVAEHLFARLPRTLLHLDASVSVVGPEGLAVLARHMPPNLDSLRLAYAVVTPRGMRSLAPALPATLRELDLADNFRMTDEAAQTLADHMPPALEKLVLRATRVSAVGEQAIRNAAPASLTDIQFPLEGDLQKYANALQMVANGIPISDDGDE